MKEEMIKKIIMQKLEKMNKGYCGGGACGHVP